MALCSLELHARNDDNDAICLNRWSTSLSKKTLRIRHFFTARMPINSIKAVKFVLFAWGLTALSVQIGYIMP